MATVLRKRKNVVAEAWRTLPPTGKVVVGAAATFGAWRLYKGIKDKIELNEVKKETEKLTKEFNKPFVITSGKDQGVIQHIDLAQIATDLHKDYHFGLMGWFSNTPDAVKLLLKVPKPYMNSLEYIYNRVYKENLHTVTKKEMSTDQWKEVEYLFY